MMVGHQILLLLAFLHVSFSEEETPLPYKELARHLYGNICSTPPCPEKWALPSNTVEIKFGVALIDIIDFDPETGKGSFKFWERYLWRDSNLKWDPAEFGGINNFRAPPFSWMPDITLYNGLNVHPERSNPNVIVYHTGEVLWIPEAIHRVRCIPRNDTKKSFECLFKFGSWSYDGDLVVLDFYEGLAAIDMNDYRLSSDFHIVDTSAKFNEVFYTCCPEPYPDLTFKLTLTLN